MRQHVDQALQCGDVPRAARLAEHWVSRNPGDSLGWLVLSGVRARQAQFADAIAAASRAAAIGMVASRGQPGKTEGHVLSLLSVENSWCDYSPRLGPRVPNTTDVNHAVPGCMKETFVLLNGEQIPWRQIRDKGPYTVIFNAITVAERTQRSLGQVREIAEALQLPVINVPEEVARTSRAVNSRRYAGMRDALFPRTESVSLKSHGRDAGHEVLRAAESRGFHYPLLVRWPGYNGSISLALCDTPDAVVRLPWPRRVHEALLIDFHDFKGGDGRYRKARIFSVGTQLMPHHLLMGDVWKLNANDGSGLAYHYKAGPLQDEILAYTRDWRAWAGERALSGLEEVRARTHLDFYGIDFTVLPDGRALIFELNPAMNMMVSFTAADGKDMSVHRQTGRLRDRIFGAFAELVSR